MNAFFGASTCIDFIRAGPPGVVTEVRARYADVAEVHANRPDIALLAHRA